MNIFQNQEKNGIPEDLEHYNRKIEEIELSIRDTISTKLDVSAELDAYQEYVPSHLKEKVEGRIKSWVSKNPGEDKSQFLLIRRKLDFFDLQEYFELVTAKNVWPLFEETFGSKGNLQVRFGQLGELRNGIRHSRGATEVTIKDGEASIAWFSSILRSSYISLEQENSEDA
ncbi:MAG: hypothetical protein IPN86_18200 [Saprospiraceae bacterium]|nr:hypothetical protein [Saprospiraceae bacterium]